MQFDFKNPVPNLPDTPVESNIGADNQPGAEEYVPELAEVTDPNDPTYVPPGQQTVVETPVETPTPGAPVVETPAEVTPPEQFPASTEVEFEAQVPNIAQYLVDEGLLKHIPEDIDLDNFDIAAYKKTIEHNQSVLQTEAYSEGSKATKQTIIDRLSPLSQKIVSFNLDNPNATDAEIRQITSDIVHGEYLNNLTVENDGERIVREYYKENGWEDKDIDTKIDTLVKTQSLSAEATILKPKLEEIAGNIAQRKTKEAAALKEYEDKLQTSLEEKALTQIKTGKLNGVPLDQETAKFLYAAVMNSEVPVEMGNRTIHMGYAEALMRQQKYGGNIENVMLSLLVLKNGPEVIEKYYAKQAKTQEVAKHVKEVKFRNNKRKSDINSVESPMTSTGFKFKVKETE